MDRTVLRKIIKAFVILTALFMLLAAGIGLGRTQCCANQGGIYSIREQTCILPQYIPVYTCKDSISEWQWEEQNDG